VVDVKNLKRYVALKIKVDFNSGRRAGNINPRDPGLFVLAQNLEDGYEIRLVLDDRNIDKYKQVSGIEIIEGIENIDRAIIELLPNDEQYLYARDDVLFQAALIAKHNDPKDTFSVDMIPNESSVVEVKDDGIYVDGTKLMGAKVSLRYAKKLGKQVPFKTTMAQLPVEYKSRIINIWLLRNKIPGIRIIRKVRKLSDLVE